MFQVYTNIIAASTEDFVGRLQDLENEMKNVLSICDESNQGINSNKRMQKRVQNPVRYLSTNFDYNNIGKSSNEEPNKVTAEDVKPRKGSLHKKCLCEKPSSAPGQLPSMKKDEVKNAHSHESDDNTGYNNMANFVADRYSGRKRFSGHLPAGSKKRESLESVESSEWFDCSAQNYEPEETPSKRLTIYCATCRRRTFDCICQGKQCTQTQHRSCGNDIPEDLEDDSKECYVHHIKPDLQKDLIINGLVREIEKKEMEAKSSVNKDIHKTFKNLRNDQADIKKTKDIESGEKDNVGKYGRMVQISLDENKCLVRPATAPAKTRKMEKLSSCHQIADKNEPRRRNRSIVNIADRELEKIPHIRLNLHLIPEEQQGETGNSVINRPRLHCKSEGNVQNISEEYSHSDAESSIDPKEDIAHLKRKKNLSDSTTRKIAQIIEKNHEKIEKMRRSRSIAIDAVKVMKEKNDALIEIKNELSGNVEKLLIRNEELMRELKERDESKQRLIQEWENYKKANPSTALLNKAQNINEENSQSKEQIQVVEQQLQEKMQWTDHEGNNNGSAEKIADANQDKCHEYHMLFKRQEAAYRRLVEGIEVMEKVIRNNKEKEKRFSDIKAELKRRAAKTQCYIERLVSEKMELIHVVKELQLFLEKQESKMNELQEEINKKDEELEKQKKLLEEKSENLEDTNKELESIRRTSLDLEDQVRTLRKSIENFDQMHQKLLKERQSFENTVQQIQEENAKLQKQLSNEKESIQIKNKIIEDQQETIKNLKEKSDEVITMVGKIQSLERLINIEREEKLEQQETIERLRRNEEELMQKVNSLEADLLLAPQEVVRDLQRTQIVLHELENQVQIKQNEWEMVVQSLIREKEQACSVAAFATKKLIQTTSDFQRQSDSQKKLYKVLAENLMDKRLHHNESAEKTVRFSDDLLQSNTDRELRANAERNHLHLKQAGILKKSRKWCPSSRSPPECFSNINFKQLRDFQPSEDFFETDDI